jgi:hypothetical protein
LAKTINHSKKKNTTLYFLLSTDSAEAYSAAILITSEKIVGPWNFSRFRACLYANTHIF